MATKTPLSRVYFVLSIITLILFGSLYFITSQRNFELSRSYANLESEGSKAFGVIKDLNLTETRGNKNYIYTYSVSDESGRLTEVVEYVDPVIHKKLRIGDSVIVVRKTTHLLGQKILISRMIGNQGRIPVNVFIEIFSGAGVLFSFILFGVSYLLHRRQV
jgi:hypothetical protein